MKNNLLNEVLNHKNKKEPKLFEEECQNCGKKVMITLPFYGCIFCS